MWKNIVIVVQGLRYLVHCQKFTLLNSVRVHTDKTSPIKTMYEVFELFLSLNISKLDPLGEFLAVYGNWTRYTCTFSVQYLLNIDCCRVAPSKKLFLPVAERFSFLFSSSTFFVAPGVDYMHPDLKYNYVSRIWFVNRICATSALPHAVIVNEKLGSTDFDWLFLLQNAEASYDFSSNDPFPYPRYTDDWFNR